MIDPRALTAFGERFDGELVLPGSAGYEAARVVWNGMVDRRPAVVARCAGVGDVRAAILFGREHDLPIAIRAGGHSLAGFSTCDDGIVIDLSRIHGVEVDPERRVARVLGGSLLRELDEAAQSHGLVCPVGVVGHTGVAGLTLGGGMGRLQRRLGFTIDSLLGVELVTADGEHLRVDGDERPELFWGIRGAGANFGVVTAFEFRLHELAPTIVNGLLVFREEHGAAVAERVRTFLADAPDEVMVSVGFGRADGEFLPGIAGRPYVAVGTTYSGSPGGAEDALRPLLGPLRGSAPLEDTVQPRNYLELQTMSDEAMAWGKRFYMKGAFLSELSDAFVSTALGAVEDAPGPGASITLWAHGGAIARIPEEATAFTGRGAAFWIGVEAEWDDAVRDDEHVGWARSANSSFRPFTAAGHYVNDMIEVGDDVVRGTYGDAKYERLIELKRTYDADNVFRLNQNVRP